MRGRWFGVFPLITLALVNCGAPQPTADLAPHEGDPHRVLIQNFAFVPKTLTVPKGTTVTWVNIDMTQHTVTSAEAERYNSGMLGNRVWFQHTFTNTGTFQYYCIPHPGMQAMIIVQ